MDHVIIIKGDILWKKDGIFGITKIGNLQMKKLKRVSANSSAIGLLKSGFLNNVLKKNKIIIFCLDICLRK